MELLPGASQSEYDYYTKKMEYEAYRERMMGMANAHANAQKAMYGQAIGDQKELAAKEEKQPLTVLLLEDV